MIVVYIICFVDSLILYEMITIEIVDRYGKMRKINDFDTVHESLICEYFYICII